VHSLLMVLLLGSLAFGQAKPTAKPKPRTAHPAAPAASKPSVPKVTYLGSPLDLATANLGPGFQGNDISAIYEAIKNSAALKPKSEFETTTQYEARRKSFADQPIMGTLTLASALAFIVSTDSPIYGAQFKYDADSQTLAFTLEGRSMTFYLDSVHPELDTILIRSTELDSGTYIASNAFGAKVKVDKTYSRDNGVAFAKDNWLFKSSESYSRKFTLLFTMTPDQARAVKENGRVLLICKLVDPWFSETVHGHEAKIDEPYDTTVSDNYLQAVPLQLWIFNQKTGEVLSRISELSVAKAQDEQLAIKLKQTPLLLEVSAGTTFLYTVSIDGQPGKLEHSDGKTKEFGARSKIVFTVEYPRNLLDYSFKLNGKPYEPDWQKDSTKIGNYESIRSATAVISLP
jgi:hypothetical protein